MTQVYRTLRVAPSDEGVLGVVIDAPPMNLIGPELVRDLVGLLGALESDQKTRVMVLESADSDYFVPHVDLTKVAQYTAEAALRPITAPTLVIWGERDRYLGPELAEPEHDDVPNLASVERLPDASHWVHHDEADRVTQLLTGFFTGQ